MGFYFRVALSLPSRHHEYSSPENCMDRKLLKLHGDRLVQEILWGFYPFMDLVIDECVEMAANGQQNNTGVVAIGRNSMLEALEQG